VAGLIIATTNPACQSCILTSKPLVARTNVFRKIKYTASTAVIQLLLLSELIVKKPGNQEGNSSFHTLATRYLALTFL
jgi:hypothetical protein